MFYVNDESPAKENLLTNFGLIITWTFYMFQS
jgi:hypothetical protein